MICLHCRTLDLVGERCPKCNSSLRHAERLGDMLADYGRGLDRRTRSAQCVIEPDFGGYLKVVDPATGEAYMCGFDNEMHAFDWAISNGLLPTRSDDDTLKILNLFSLSEK